MEDLEVWDKLTAAEESGYTDADFGVDTWFPDKLHVRTYQDPPKTRRWSEAHPGAALFHDGVDVRDISQGALGTCWFIGSLSAIATKPDFIKKIFLRSESGKNAEAGVYGVQLYEGCLGGWQKYLLDDVFPVDGQGRLKFARSMQRKEIWPTLVEKCVAKHYGSYQAVDGGNSATALHMLTGAFIEAYHYRWLRQAVKGNLWDRMVAACEAGNVGSCAVRPGVHGSTGLIGNHVYGILGCKVLDDGTRLVHMKNPWGHKGEWKGDWGDKSDRWTEETQAALGHDPTKNDGVFWMPWGDLTTNIDALSIAYINGPPATMVQTDILTNSKEEAGSNRGDRRWLCGRKFRLKNTTDAEQAMFFTAMSGPKTLSVIWAFTEKEDLKSTLVEENIVVDGCHQGGRINCCSFTVPAGGSLIFLLSFRADTPYLVQAVGEGAELEVLQHVPEDWARPVAQAGADDVFDVPDEWSQSLHSGTWSCYGHGAGPVFGSFQKVWFAISEPAEVLIKLEQDRDGSQEADEFLPIEFYVLTRADWQKSVKKWMTMGMVINKDMVGAKQRATWNKQPLQLEPGSYCIIPMCNGYLPPEFDRDWNLVVASSVPLQSSDVERPPVPSVKEEILESFKKFDKNKDGSMDIDELASLFKTLNSEQWTDKDVQSLMKVMDRDANGRVSYGEFVDWIFDNTDEEGNGPF